MKSIALITFHTPKNFGAVLQAYSLMTYLKKQGYDVRIIDFNTSHLRSIYPLYRWPHTVKQMVREGFDALYVVQKKKKYNKFSQFVNEKMELTRRYETIAELQAEPPSADYYITGSDQVFNPNRIDEERKAFYLDFGDPTVKRIAYAASFGVNSVPEDRKLEIAKRLSAFSSISVREESGLALVHSLSEKTATEVLDPVFLNGKEFWKKSAEKYPVGNKQYLLYYRLMDEKKSDDIAQKIAKEKKLKLVVITDGFLKWRANRVLRDVGPQEFLYLFDNAEYIVTNSFHGVAFSLIFEKQFIFSNYQPNLADRTMNLLYHVHSEESAALNGNEGDYVLDYEKIHSELRPMIIQSKLFLENALMDKEQRQETR